MGAIKRRGLLPLACDALTAEVVFLWIGSSANFQKLPLLQEVAVELFALPRLPEAFVRLLWIRLGRSMIFPHTD